MLLNPLPDLEIATDDDIADLAANALQVGADLRALCHSSAHIRRLCELIETLSLRNDELTDKLAASAAAHKLTNDLYVAELKETSRLRALHADLSERLCNVLAPQPTVKIADYSPAELEAEWAAADRAEHAALERAQRRAEASTAFRSTSLLFDVSDTVVMDERDIAIATEQRVPTREVPPLSMHEIVYGGAA